MFYYIMKYFIIVLIIIIIILCVFINKNKLFNKPENFENNDIEIVVARYNEDLEWLREKPYSTIPVIIYNKGPNQDFYKPLLLKKIVKLPNVGVCDHTYLYHIIENYDNLSNVTIFLPGSCMDDTKIERTETIVNNTIETNNTVIYGDYNIQDIKDRIYDFTLDNWFTSNKKNKELNNSSKLRQCDINPFGKWYESIFEDITNNYMSILGIFSASRKHIHNKDKDFYEKLIEFVNKNKNEECAHYIERSWISILSPLPDKYIIK